MILAKLSVIEQNQRTQAQLTQQLINLSQVRDETEAELPDNIRDKLPLQSITDINNLEEQLEDKDLLRKLVCSLIISTLYSNHELQH